MGNLFDDPRKIVLNSIAENVHRATSADPIALKADSADAISIPGGRDLRFNLAPVIIVGIGIVMVLASLFMPNLASGSLSIINSNMVIENNPVRAIGVIAAVISTIRYYNAGSYASANLAISVGLSFLAWIIFYSSTAQLYSLALGIEFAVKNNLTVETSPGAGQWTGGVGYAIIALGGLMMRFPHSGFGLVTGAVIPTEEISEIAATKDCPRCAETIKAAALVCRFCNHEFEAAISPGNLSSVKIGRTP